MPDRQVQRKPLVAVVVPVYKQPQYIAEAVLSVHRSSLAEAVKIVIVNDGCPYASTEETGLRLADMLPGQVRYLRQPNAGLSAARNSGIEFALAAWPTVTAVFPLDGDNKVSPHTLERLWRALDDSGLEIGWVYQDLTIFGARASGWGTGAPFSLYRLAFENFCDAGSLIRREVFEAGVWYDEAMRQGYEDWEFALCAGKQGFRGLHVPDTGFLYRERAVSMLTAARARHEEVASGIRAKHREFYGTMPLLALEHKEMPRYAIIDVDAGTVALVTDPLDPAPVTITTAEYVRRLGTWRAEAEPKRTYVPPFTLFASGHWLRNLGELGLLPGLLFTTQTTAPLAPSVVIDVAEADAPEVVELTADKSDNAALVFTRTSELFQLAATASFESSQTAATQWPGRTEALALHLGSSIVPVSEERTTGVIPSARSILADIQAATAEVAPEEPAPWPAMGSHTYFAERLQLDSAESRFPYRLKPTTNVLFTVPWLTYAGVDRCVIKLASELQRMGGRYAVHLLTTHTNRVEVKRETLNCFATVSFLPAVPERRAVALKLAAASADVIINAHSLATYEVLPELHGKPHGKIISYLHVIDQDQFGVPWGYPLIATQRYESMIDQFVVISDDLRRVCLRNGVPMEKLTHVPNAPTVSPPSLAEAKRIAAAKAARRFDDQCPVRLLFAGRLDRQKGIDRLGPIALALRRARVPFELQVVGRAVLGGVEVKLPTESVLLPPSLDPHRLAKYYTDADVFLLPSRWEGVPLAILEAMTFGAIVVATDVGAVREVVLPGRTGFLVDPDTQPAEMAEAIAAAVRRLLDEPAGVAAIRNQAVETAMSLSWSTSAMRLAAAIEEAVA